MLVGCPPASHTPVESLLQRVSGIADLNELAASLPGSFHLLASVGGQVRVQGSASGLRRVFHTRVGDVDVASDQANILACLNRSGIDPQRLSLRLLYPALPHPLGLHTPWQDIIPLPEDCYLRMPSAGAAHPVHWWMPPNPVASLAEGADRVRSALASAVEARTAPGGTVSCDLSGGLDSTPIFHLASQGTSELIGFTTGGPDIYEQEMAWADTAAAGLTHVHRERLPSTELPSPYVGVTAALDGLDEPFTGIPNRNRLTAIARHLSPLGARVHLTGHGGDEVFVGAKSYLRDLFRSDPVRALSHARAHGTLKRWPTGQLLRALLDRRPYPRWLADGAKDLTRQPRLETPRMGWAAVPFRLPPWVTQEAADAVRGQVREAAAGAEPLAAEAGQHEAIDRVRNAARLIRHDQAVMARAGLPMAAPLLDDRVIEACLSVRLPERSTPWATKPVLVEAVSGLIPDDVLNRSTKTDGTNDHYVGLRKARPEFQRICENSQLARAGIIDVEKLRPVLMGAHPPRLWSVALWQTLACEMWLYENEGAERRKS